MALPPLLPPPPPTPPPDNNLPNRGLLELENNLGLDFLYQYKTVYNDENLLDDPYANITLRSNFYDLDSITNICVNGQSMFMNHESKRPKSK